MHTNAHASELPTIDFHGHTTAFSATLRDSLESLRISVEAATRCPIELHYGVTDDGSEHWAALTVEELPLGSFGRPGPLMSMLIGASVPGFAVVMAGDWHATVCTIKSRDHLADGLRIAEAEALARFADLAEGACA